MTLYARDATPRATWAVPPGFLANDRALAWDGEHVAFLAATKGYAADQLVLDTIGAHERTTFPIDAKPGAAVFLVRPAATPEIWLFDGAATIRRFALPAPG